MPEHPNAAPARALFEAFAQRDTAAMRSVIAEDAVWHFPGRRGAIAGDHAGHDGIFRFLVSVMTLTAGSFHLELHDIAAGEAGAVAFFTGHGQRNGKTLHNPTCLRMASREGRITELWEYVWDLEQVEDFWS
jgi:ketosteroid isomerase-like protein